MPASTVVKNLCDGTITLRDATGSPISVTVKYDNADFSIENLREDLREVVAYQSRGALTSLRHTTRVFPTFSFSAQMAEFSAATAVSLSDAVLRNGAFAAAVSTATGGANADVYCLDVVITEEGTNFGDSSDHTFTLGSCHMTLSYNQGDPNTFTISGTVYGAISGDLAI